MPSLPHPRFIATLWAEVAVYDRGGAGRPVVLIHGNSASSKLWKRQFADPALGHVRLIALDLPGHGRSGRAGDPAAAYTPAGHVGTVHAVIAALGLPANTVIAGWSLGAHIALEAAATRPDSPVGDIGACPVGPGPEGVAAAYRPVPAFAYTFKADLSEEEMRLYGESWFAPGADVPDLVTEDIRRTDPMVRRYLGEAIAASRHGDEWTIAATHTAPIAILHGAEDPFVNTDTLAGLTFRDMLGGTPTVVERAGHAPMWERPDIVNPWLARLAAV